MPENMPLNMAELSGIELRRPSVDVQTFNSRNTCWDALSQRRRDGEKCSATEPDAAWTRVSQTHICASIIVTCLTDFYSPTSTSSRPWARARRLSSVSPASAFWVSFSVCLSRTPGAQRALYSLVPR